MSNRTRFWMLLACVALAIPACALPGMTPPTPIVLPTPNATLTAIFQPTVTETPALVPTLGIPTLTPTAQAGTQPATAAATLDPSKARPNGTPVRAARLSAPPTVDGDLAEWSSSVYAANQVVFGSANWTGAADSSGSYYIGWDASSLYLAIGVRDDKHVQLASGSKLYLGDDVEIQLDANLAADFTSTYLSSDDYQLGLSAGDFASRAPEAYRWYPSAMAGKLSGVTVKAKSTADGYILEAQIPWSTLGITPAEGQSFGFALSLSDNDKAGAAVQQSMVSSVATRKLLNPTTWGTLVLEGSAGK
jgi:hypothetical protein